MELDGRKTPTDQDAPHQPYHPSDRQRLKNTQRSPFSFDVFGGQTRGNKKMKKKNNQDDDLFVNSGTTSQSSFNRKSRWDVPSRVLKLDPHQLELAVTDPEKFSTFEFEEEGGKGKKRKEKKKLKSTLFDEERIYLHVSLVETKWPSHWYLTLLRHKRVQTSMTIFECTNNEINDSFGSQIIHSLKNCQKLEKVLLSSNLLGLDTCVSLKKLFSSQKNIKTLNLSGNEITDEALSHFFPAPPHLSRLDLSANILTDKSAPLIARTIQQDSLLSSLKLSHNQLGDRAGFALARALKNGLFANIDLEENCLGDEAAEAFLEVLSSTKERSSLVNLNGNRIGPKFMDQLSKYFPGLVCEDPDAKNVQKQKSWKPRIWEGKKVESKIELDPTEEISNFSSQWGYQTRIQNFKELLRANPLYFVPTRVRVKEANTFLSMAKTLHLQERVLKGVGLVVLTSSLSQTSEWRLIILEALDALLEQPLNIAWIISEEGCPNLLNGIISVDQNWCQFRNLRNFVTFYIVTLFQKYNERRSHLETFREKKGRDKEEKKEKGKEKGKEKSKEKRREREKEKEKEKEEKEKEEEKEEEEKEKGVKKKRAFSSEKEKDPIKLAVCEATKKVGHPITDAPPYLSLLRKNWYTSFESIEELGVSGLKSLGFPHRLAVALLQQISSRSDVSFSTTSKPPTQETIFLKNIQFQSFFPLASFPESHSHFVELVFHFVKNEEFQSKILDLNSAEKSNLISLLNQILSLSFSPPLSPSSLSSSSSPPPMKHPNLYLFCLTTKLLIRLNRLGLLSSDMITPTYASILEKISSQGHSRLRYLSVKLIFELLSRGSGDSGLGSDVTFRYLSASLRLESLVESLSLVLQSNAPSFVVNWSLYLRDFPHPFLGKTQNDSWGKQNGKEYSDLNGAFRESCSLVSLPPPAAPLNHFVASLRDDKVVKETRLSLKVVQIVIKATSQATCGSNGDLMMAERDPFSSLYHTVSFKLVEPLLTLDENFCVKEEQPPEPPSSFQYESSSSSSSSFESIQTSPISLYSISPPSKVRLGLRPQKRRISTDNVLHSRRKPRENKAFKDHSAKGSNSMLAENPSLSCPSPSNVQDVTSLDHAAKKNSAEGGESRKSPSSPSFSLPCPTISPPQEPSTPPPSSPPNSPPTTPPKVSGGSFPRTSKGSSPLKPHSSTRQTQLGITNRAKGFLEFTEEDKKKQPLPRSAESTEFMGSNIWVMNHHFLSALVSLVNASELQTSSLSCHLLYLLTLYATPNDSQLLTGAIFFHLTQSFPLVSPELRKFLLAILARLVVKMADSHARFLLGIRDSDIRIPESFVYLLFQILNNEKQTTWMRHAAANVIANLAKIESVQPLISSLATLPSLRYLTDFGLVTTLNRPIRREAVRVVREVGRGAIGIVFEAVFEGKPVAMKSFNKESLGFNMAEFRLEVALMTVLEHPRVVGAYGASLSPPDLFIVSPYYSKGNLEERLHGPSAEPITFEKMYGMVIDIVDGMAYLHDSGVIHRDLKPQNLLVDKDDRIYVCDFGTARFQGHRTKDFGGTMIYSAPEILSSSPRRLPGHSWTKEADVYSFGIVLWELFHRQRPFSGDGIYADLVVQILSGYRDTIDPCLTPEEIAQLISYCWSQDPSNRPSFLDISVQLREGLEMIQMRGENSYREGGRGRGWTLLPKNQELKEEEEETEEGSAGGKVLIRSTSSASFLSKRKLLTKLEL